MILASCLYDEKNIHMQQHVDAPVLLITFNRPANTRKVFEKIRQARVPRLYVFNDGPRENNDGDAAARKAVQDMLTEIDWPCELFTLFPAKNTGCAVGVSSAITWAFEQEDRLVILEDDCVPSLAFFDYCNNLLERYKDDTRVWMISGNNYNEEFTFNSSYIFSRAAIHIWGWATWKRSWKHYDLTLDVWPSFNHAKGFDSIFSSEAEVVFWTKRYDRLYKQRNKVMKSTWDYQYVLSLFINSGLCIVPAKNLVINIGYQGAHTSEQNGQHGRKASASFEIKRHPEFILVNKAYDMNHLKQHWMKKKPVLTRLSKKLSNLMK